MPDKEHLTSVFATLSSLGFEIITKREREEKNEIK